MVGKLYIVEMGRTIRNCYILWFYNIHFILYNTLFLSGSNKKLPVGIESGNYGDFRLHNILGTTLLTVK